MPTSLQSVAYTVVKAVAICPVNLSNCIYLPWWLVRFPVWFVSKTVDGVLLMLCRGLFFTCCWLLLEASVLGSLFAFSRMLKFLYPQQIEGTPKFVNCVFCNWGRKRASTAFFLGAKILVQMVHCNCFKEISQAINYSHACFRGIHGMQKWYTCKRALPLRFNQPNSLSQVLKFNQSPALSGLFFSWGVA